MLKQSPLAVVPCVYRSYRGYLRCVAINVFLGTLSTRRPRALGRRQESPKKCPFLLLLSRWRRCSCSGGADSKEKSIFSFIAYFICHSYSYLMSASTQSIINHRTYAGSKRLLSIQAPFCICERLESYYYRLQSIL